VGRDRQQKVKVYKVPSCLKIGVSNASMFRHASSMTEVSAMNDGTARGGYLLTSSPLSAASVKKDVSRGGDAETAANPLLPMWVHSQLEIDSAAFTSTISDDSFSTVDDCRQAPSSRAMSPMQVRIVKLGTELSSRKPGTLCTPLNVKAAAFVPKGGDQRTTVMMRNLPTALSRAKLIDLLEEKGFEGQFDLLYLPMDFKTKCNFGFAFVNLTTHENALRFSNVFHNFASWSSSRCRKVCAVCWGEVQGLHANVVSYQNSAVMRKQDVPDDYKPAMFQNGLQIPFPRTTSESKPKRSRTRTRTEKSEFGSFE